MSASSKKHESSKAGAKATAKAKGIVGGGGSGHSTDLHSLQHNGVAPLATELTNCPFSQEISLNTPHSIQVNNADKIRKLRLRLEQTNDIYNGDRMGQMPEDTADIEAFASDSVLTKFLIAR